MLREPFGKKLEERLLLSRKWLGDYTELPRSFSDSMEHPRDSCCSSFCSEFLKLWKNLGRAASNGVAMEKSEPRNVVFATKKGLALILVSLLFSLKMPPKDSLWAALAVVLVFEFSIGATLSIGSSCGFGVLLAGGSALAMGELSKIVGNWGVVIAVLGIFITGFCTTYAKKLHPGMKAFEYGIPVFLILCCFIMVSGFETRKVMETAATPFILIALGAGVSFLVNISIYPVWAGQDLHNLVVQHFMNIANSLEGCVNAYLNCVEYERIPAKILTFQASDDPMCKGYQSAMKSISQEDALLSFAVWEPPHGPYKMFKHPWKNYVEVSGALRHCAIMLMALHGCILSEIQAPPEKRQVFRRDLQRVGIASAQVLRLLGSKVQTMEKLGQIDILYEVHEAAEELQILVDKKSYLFVNPESWEIGEPQQKPKFVDNYLDINDDDTYYFKERKSMSGESAVIIDIEEPVPLSRSLSDGGHNFRAEEEEHISRASSGQLLPNLLWPEVGGGQPWLDELQESKTYENACSLSLATFSYLLIEFVARLQNVVDCFQELSEKAKFRDPVNNLQEAAAGVGFLRRIFNFFSLQSIFSL